MRRPRLPSRDVLAALGSRVPADHARQTIADAYAPRLVAGRSDPFLVDLGCGGGDSVDLFRALAPGVRWLGLDIVASAEVAARTRADADFATFDGVSIPLEDRSVDGIYCKQVLEHVERPRELLREAGRVLAPGGRLAGSVSQLEPYHSRSVQNLTPYGLTLLLEEAGLEVEELRPGIDAATLVAWGLLRMPAGFGRWWARDSPGNRTLELAGRAVGASVRERNAAKLLLCGQFAFLARRP